MGSTPCCMWCGSVDRWSYALCGDGDGIEFLIETAYLSGGGETTSTVVYSAPGPADSR